MKFRSVTLAAVFFNAKIFEKQKTSLRSPSLASRVTASSPGRFDRKVGRDHKPKILQFSGRVHWNFRLAVAPDFAVIREARLSDRKLVFFPAILALKNTAS